MATKCKVCKNADWQQEDEKWVRCDVSGCKSYFHKNCLGILSTATDAELQGICVICVKCESTTAGKAYKSQFYEETTNKTRNRIFKIANVLRLEMKSMDGAPGAKGGDDTGIPLVIRQSTRILDLIEEEVKKLVNRQTTIDTIDKLGKIVNESANTVSLLKKVVDDAKDTSLSLKKTKDESEMTSLQLKKTTVELRKATTTSNLAQARSPGAASYATMVKKQGEKHKLLVTTRDNAKIEDFKETIKSCRGDANANVINTSFRDKSMAMEFETVKERDDMMEAIKNRNIDVELRNIKALQPRIKIKNIPKESENIVDQIIARNYYLTEGNKNDMKFIFAVNKGYKKDVVIQCSPDLRKLLREKGDRVNLDWEVREVEDHFLPTVCYKCQGYGHTQGNCNYDKACRKCSSKEHETRDCQSSQTDYKCVNCEKAKCDANHQANDTRECKSYKEAMRKVIQRTNNGV